MFIRKLTTSNCLKICVFVIWGGFALIPSPSRACAHPINPALLLSRLETMGLSRDYLIAGCADHVPAEGLPIVFAFHGGGERLHRPNGRGFLDFTALGQLNALVIAPMGQNSHNGRSWLNAFVWMKKNPQNDFDLAGAVINEVKKRTDLPPVNVQRVFALGKSDGAGMAMALACNRPPGLPLRGVALVSGAYFGLQAETNFGATGRAICLPAAPLPMLIIHGTGDRVMPYRGQNFRNPKALKGAHDHWASIDPGVNDRTSQTFTADILRYVEALSALVFHCDGMRSSALGHVSTVAEGTQCTAPFRVITIAGGNHVWPGHAGSGPQSGQPQNMDFDATAEIAGFFGIMR